MENNQPKRQHILPQRYQAGFASVDGCVWHLDRRRGIIASTHPKRVAVENHFYTYEPKNDPDATTLETFFANHVEGPFWPVLERIEKQEIPTSNDRMRVAFFAAFMLTRVPAFRELSTKVFGNAIISVSKLYPNLEFLDGLLQKSSGGILKPTEPKNNVLVRMANLGMEIGKHLLTLDTHFMYSPEDEPFITTDNPFVLVQMVKDFQPPTVSATSFMKWIPLSAKLAVGFGLPGNHIYLIKVESAKTRKINIGTATAARQIIIARNRKQLEEILSTIPKGIPDGAHNFPSVVL
jgi:hypothetical protein